MIYILIFLIILSIIINNFSKRYVLSKVYYYREISKKIVEIGEEITLTSIVENRKILPVTFLQIIEQLPDILEYKFKTIHYIGRDFLYHTMTFFILPYQRIKREYLAVCNKRGRYIFGDVFILGGDFLGLNITSKVVNFFQEIIVLPKRIDIERNLIPYGDYYGDLSVKRWIIEDPTMIIGIKEYTGQEPVKNIHWKSYLKYGKLMVKQFDFTYENTAMIIFNGECVRPYWSEIDELALENCISIIRSIGEIFKERKIPFGFVTNVFIYGLPRKENMIYPSLGESHFYTFLEYLGRISYSISFPIEEIFQKLKNKNFISTFVIITPRVLNEYINYINSLVDELHKIILISYYDENLNLISDKIQKFTFKREKDGTFIS
jgi:hypothetical protein